MRWGVLSSRRPSARSRNVTSAPRSGMPISIESTWPSSGPSQPGTCARTPIATSPLCSSEVVTTTCAKSWCRRTPLLRHPLHDRLARRAGRDGDGQRGVGEPCDELRRRTRVGSVAADGDARDDERLLAVVHDRQLAAVAVASELAARGDHARRPARVEAHRPGAAQLLSEGSAGHEEDRQEERCRQHAAKEHALHHQPRKTEESTTRPRRATIPITSPSLTRSNLCGSSMPVRTTTSSAPRPSASREQASRHHGVEASNARADRRHAGRQDLGGVVDDVLVHHDDRPDEEAEQRRSPTPRRARRATAGASSHLIHGGASGVRVARRAATSPMMAAASESTSAAMAIRGDTVDAASAARRGGARAARCDRRRASSRRRAPAPTEQRADRRARPRGARGPRGLSALRPVEMRCTIHAKYGQSDEDDGDGRERRDDAARHVTGRARAECTGDDACEAGRRAGRRAERRRRSRRRRRASGRRRRQSSAALIAARPSVAATRIMTAPAVSPRNTAATASDTQRCERGARNAVARS